jgi:trigger factor
MNITVTDQEKCKKQLRIEIPGDAVRNETDKVAGQFARTVSLPGFRRGHAPKSVVKTRFRKELRDEVVAHLLPESFRDAVLEKDLKVIGEPSIENLKFGDDESINVSFIVEVKPDFELANYKSLPLTKRVYKIRDEDVEQTVESLRNEHAELAPVEERGAQAGDIVTATMTGRFEPVAAKEESAEAEEAKPEASEDKSAEDKNAEEKNAEEKNVQQLTAGGGEPATDEEIKQEDVDIEIGADGVLKEFSEGLTGARPGDTRTFSITYPDEYKPEKFAGRRVNYTADVIAVRVKELPEPNDEFAQSVGGSFNTMDEMRSHIRKTLEHDAEHRADAEARSAAMDALVDRNRFEVPDFAVEKQMDSRLNALVSQLANQGIDPRRMQIDWSGIREGQRERAEREVRGAFILENIANAEKIEVSDEDVDRELEQYAEGSNQTVAALKGRLTKEGALDSIKEQVRNRKALDLVLDSAENTIEEVEGLRGNASATGESEPEGGEA